MGLNHSTRVLRFIVLASLTLTVAIGCGDGKPKKRQAVRKNPNATNQKIDPKTGKPIPATPAAPAAETDEDRKKTAETLEKKRKAEERFDGMLKQLNEGPLMEKSALDAGTYKIALITTNVKYMKGSDWMRAHRTQTLRIDSANKPQPGPEPTEGLGAAANDPDRGRTFEIPGSFIVSKEDGFFRAERSSFGQFILLHTKATTQMNKGDFKVELVNTVGGGLEHRSNTKASIAEMLATAHIEKKELNDLFYEVTDSNKKIELRLRKVADNKIRAIFEIFEIPNELLRTVAVDYDLVEKAKPAPAPAPAQPAPAATGMSGHGTPPPQDNSAGAAPAPTAVAPGLPPEQD
jgi:hypothetical protein